MFKICYGWMCFGWHLQFAVTLGVLSNIFEKLMCERLNNYLRSPKILIKVCSPTLLRRINPVLDFGEFLFSKFT